MPTTFKDRPNGNRVDISQLLDDVHPKFLRCPGGNYVEGDYFNERFDWKHMIGPVEQRPGHHSCWGYPACGGKSRRPRRQFHSQLPALLHHDSGIIGKIKFPTRNPRGTPSCKPRVIRRPLRGNRVWSFRRVAPARASRCANLDRVCTDEYLDFNDYCPGVLKNACGNKPAYSSWGDYFLMEALSLELKRGEMFW